MIFRKTQLVSRKSFFLFIYCAVILSASVYSLKRPAYNWDILPYMGVILSYDKVEPNTIHSNVYAIAKEQIPPAFYNLLIDPSSGYRKNAEQSPEAFRLQLPFYLVKPLYTGISYLFYKAGASLPLSTVWPSVISYFFIALLLFGWLKKYWPVLYAFTGSTLIMFSPPLLSVAKLSTPDALSGLLVFAAVYLAVEKKSLLLTFTFLLLAVFARLDNIIPAIFLLATLVFSNNWGNKIPAGRVLLLLAVMMLSYFTISHNVSSFGWSLFYYPTFVKQLNPSYNINNAFIFKDYLALAKSQFMTGLYFSFASLFFFLVLLLLSDRSLPGFSWLTIEQTFSLVFILIMVTRFVLQPLIADRLYIPYYLAIIAFLVKKYSFATNGQQLYPK
jgi:hypothetical protein